MAFFCDFSYFLFNIFPDNCAPVEKVASMYTGIVRKKVEIVKANMLLVTMSLHTSS